MDNVLPDLPGFDTATALKLLGNSTKLYGNVLKKFSEKYAASYNDLAAMLKSDADWESVQREAHTLKGLAGNIGRPDLHDTAQALELSVKDVPNPDPAKVSALAEDMLAQLEKTLDILKQAFPA
ncbi:MAG: Hpt domain-containing protein [Desulfovibrionaceae bacterium]|nr:Hpt domain-containing protein [Desulfovibrionaceae bacterium]